MKTAIEIFLGTNDELMDGNRDSALYQQVFTIVENVEGATNPHRTRIRKLANSYVIDVDIEVEKTLTVEEAHEIAINVEDAIMNNIANVYDIIVHIEPEGNIEKTEKYGLCSEDL